MKRRAFLIGVAALTTGGSFAAMGSAPPPVGAFFELGQKANGISTPNENLVQINAAPPAPWAEKLIGAAERQIGITTIYDPAYVGLDYPGGDIPRDRGVCTDVIIRAYRDAFGIDLQREVHLDMASNFNAYPKIWGHKRPDRNIDHRRVPNLQTFFRRKGAEHPLDETPGAFLPGDIVSQMLPGNLPHIAIVSHRRSQDGIRPLLIHNIGAGTRLEDRLHAFEITGRFRFAPKTAT